MAVLGDRPMDQNTIDLLAKVTNQINTQNLQLITNGTINNTKTYSNTITNSTSGITPQIIDEIIEPNSSPNIDMEDEIYKNEFEGCGAVVIGNRRPQKDEFGFYSTTSLKNASIGLIDSVSEDEDDLYTKFPDGEIIPFKGHPEKFSVEIETWNDLKRSDLTGNEIRKAATCQIMINDRLARIIEGIDVQDLLMKANRAIDELKVQPFSICRDANSLIGREIYYYNQPAVIDYIDELNNFIHIIPDLRFISNFKPPAYAMEDEETGEWIDAYGSGMLVHDYDEQIWWWRNIKSNNIDPNTDPFYGQFPQPVQQPTKPWPQPPLYYPNIITTNPWTTPYAVNTPYILGNIPMTITYTTDPINGTLTELTNFTDVGDAVANAYTGLTKEQTKQAEIDLVNAVVKDINKAHYGRSYGKTAGAKKFNNLLEKSAFPDKEYNADLVEEKKVENI